MKPFFRVLAYISLSLSILFLLGYAAAFFAIPGTSLSFSSGAALYAILTLLLLATGLFVNQWDPPYKAKMISVCFLLWCGFYLMCVLKVSLWNAHLRFTFNGIPFFSLGHTLQVVQSGLLPAKIAFLQVFSAVFLCWPVCITLSAIGGRLSPRSRLTIACSVPVLLELLQGLLGRGSADIDDIFLGLAGIGLYHLVCKLLARFPLPRRS